EADSALLEQLRVGSGSRLLDRGGDAAARLRNLLVGGTRAAHCVLVRAVAAEDEMGVAIYEPGSHPCAVERVDVAGAIPRELGALADADDLAVGDSDRAILDQAERIAARGHERRDIAVDEQPVPHAGVP